MIATKVLFAKTHPNRRKSLEMVAPR